VKSYQRAMGAARGSAITRRTAIRAGVVAYLSACYSQLLGAAGADARPLITKVIPSSGERIPAIGLGSDAFQSSERDAIQAEIKRMNELQGSVIDTAAGYGDSEAIIGDALTALGIRDRMFLATKLSVGGMFSDGLSGEASYRRSLERLKTRHIDLLQVHNLSGVEKLVPMLQAWKKAGDIRYIGVTTSRVSQHAEIVEAMIKYPLDFIQVDYSIANRDAATSVFPTALERRVAVLVNLPLARAALIGQAAQRQLPDWAATIDVSSWGQFFLKYVISHPAVTCAIPGSTKMEHLEDNQGAARGSLPDAAMRERMEAFWDAKG
jgi:aryl-alcohol dehydrogenase-like predicted oxidoreductase